MYNNNSTDNSPVANSILNILPDSNLSSNSNVWNQSYLNQQEESLLQSAYYPNGVGFNYPSTSSDLTKNTGDSYNYTNQTYNYYGQVYNYNAYSQNQYNASYDLTKQNYYNCFNQQQQQQKLVQSQLVNSNDELLKIQKIVNEKVSSQNYNCNLKEIESSNQSENLNTVVNSTIGNNTSSSSENENNACESNKENDENKTESKSPLANNYPAFFTTQKIVNNTSKLSYTVYQLELLNAIYSDMKYPNSVQKTLIAKLIGITRDQVKIWFQNRRRKDTLVSQGKIPSSQIGKSQSLKRKSTDDIEDNDDYSPSSPDQNTNKKQIVENQVIENVLYQLKVHQNAPSRLSTKRSKLGQNESADDIPKIVPSYPIKVLASNDNHASAQQVNEMKPNKSNRIIDLNKNEQFVQHQPVVHNLTSSQASENQQSENILSVSSNNSSSTPTSFIITSTSSSSSSSSSGSSSSEEETNYQTYIKPEKFQVLQQSLSVQDYVDTRYNRNMYPKLPKIHNQFHNQSTNVYSPTYQQISYSTANKLNAWNTTIPTYPMYQTHQPQPAFIDQTILTKENIAQSSLNNYNQLNSDYEIVNQNQLNNYYAQANQQPSAVSQQTIQSNQYIFNESNDRAYHYNTTYSYAS